MFIDYFSSAYIYQAHKKKSLFAKYNALRFKLPIPKGFVTKMKVTLNLTFRPPGSNEKPKRKATTFYFIGVCADTSKNNSAKTCMFLQN